MANVTIPMLPVAAIVNGNDLVIIEQAGVTKQATKTLLFSDLTFTNITLVNSNLGTPTAGTLTNCIGLPILTGVSGLGTGVATFLNAPSSANLNTVVSDATGTGALVFANTPTFVTPILGDAAATSISTTSVLTSIFRGTVQSLSGPGAVDVVTYTTAFTSTGTGDALTLADGILGQVKNIIYVAETAGADTGVLTPDNFGNGTTITFNDVGDSVQLQFVNSQWWVISANGAVVA